MKTLPSLLLLVCVFGASCSASVESLQFETTTEITHALSQQAQSSTAIGVQGFHWNSWRAQSPNWYGVLQSRAADLAGLGFTHVWMPPPSDAASSEGYLPRQLNVLNSSYGSENDLRNAIGAFTTRGLRVVADVVVNHRVGTSSWADFTDPGWGCWAVVNNDEWSGRCGGNDSGDSYGPARDLDHANPTVSNDIRTWLSTRLKSVGFTGIRFDYSKGYGAGYARQYADAMGAEFCVGEIWTDLDFNNIDGHRQGLMNFVDGTQGVCGAFDFTTKGLLNQALRYNEHWRLRDSAGRPAGGIGWWAQKMVTFVDNHDTGPSESCFAGQNHWPVPCDQVMQGYAYVLTHPGIPMVYYPHIYDWNLRSAIKALIDIRRQQRITSTSAVSIQRSEQGLYAAIVNGNTAMKIGPNAWSPGAGWTLMTSGNNYAVWRR